jgi:hypothetical protein
LSRTFRGNVAAEINRRRCRDAPTICDLYDVQRVEGRAQYVHVSHGGRILGHRRPRQFGRVRFVPRRHYDAERVRRLARIDRDTVTGQMLMLEPEGETWLDERR